MMLHQERVTEPVDMGDIQLADLVDLVELNRLLDNFCQSVGIASAIIDLQGTVLTSSRWQRICTNFHRVNALTCSRCIESDTELALHSQAGQDFSIYRCKNGMTDAALPIVINGRHLANLFVGQFLLSPPDHGFFSRQADEMGFDQDAYLAALEEVPIFDEGRLSAIFGFLRGFAGLIASMGLQRMQAEQVSSDLARQQRALEQRAKVHASELALHNMVFDKISAGASLPTVLDMLTRQVDALHPGVLCSVVLLDQDGLHLRHGAAPSLPDFYNQAIAGVAIGEGVGSCGTAIYRGERVIVEDVQQHPYWVLYRELARQAGLQSCWSQPIVGREGKVLGSFAIYHRQPAAPSDAEIVLIERYARLAALAIERKRADEAFTTLSRVVEQSPVSIVITDPQGTIQYVNPKFEQITGYQSVEAIGKNPRLLSSGETSQAEYRELWETITDGKTWVGEFQNRRKDGTLFWEHASISAVLDEEGRLINFVGVKEDITQRKQAQAELQEQRNFLAAILENEPECVKVLAADGTLLQMNNAGLAMMEMGSVEEVNAFGLVKTVQAEHRAAFVDLIRRVFNGESGMLEFQIRGKQGTRRWLETRVAPLRDASGKITHMLGVTRDVTRRRDAEQRLVLSLRGSDLAMTDWYIPNDRLVFGEGWAKLLGYRTDDLRPHTSTLMELVWPEDASTARATLVRHLKNETASLEIEVRMRHKDGRWIWVRARGMVVERGPDGRALRVTGTAMDITERKRTEEKLQLAASVFVHAHEGILIADAAGVIVDVNQAFSRITGFEREEALGKKPNFLSSGRQGKDFYATMWRSLIEQGYWFGEVWNRRKDGEPYSEMLTISAVRDTQGVTRNYVALFSDITERKEMEERVQQLAFYDALTNLPNRRLLVDRLGQAVAGSQRSACYGALMFLDLDQFKPLNDAHGHAVGDLLLIEAANRLRSCVREVDTVARFGGDEFVVLLRELNADQTESGMQAQLIAEKIRVSLSAPYFLEVQQEAGDRLIVEHHCSASIGVVLFSNQNARLDDILRWADAAMYQAKEVGRNRVQFYRPNN